MCFGSGGGLAVFSGCNCKCSRARANIFCQYPSAENRDKAQSWCSGKETRLCRIVVVIVLTDWISFFSFSSSTTCSQQQLYVTLHHCTLIHRGQLPSIVWCLPVSVFSLCCLGVCSTNQGAERLQGTAAGERGRDIWAQSREEQHQGEDSVHIHLY